MVGCVVLAAGNAARFGANKLLAPFRGKPLLQWTLEALPAVRPGPVTVVTQYETAAELAEAYDCLVTWNREPERGVSHSVALGTAALGSDCEGILFLAADQPLLRRETLERLLACFAAAPDRIVAASAGPRVGNPAVFPAALFQELMKLTGDRGGSQLMRRFPALVLPVEADPAELADVDTAEDLARLGRR